MSQDGFDLSGVVSAVMNAPDQSAPQYGSEAWKRAIVAHVMQTPEPTLGQKALSVAQGLGSGVLGVAKTVASDFPAAAGKIAWGDLYREGNPIEQLGQKIEGAREAITPEDPQLRGGAPFRYSNIAGTVAPALVLSLLGPEVGGPILGAMQQGGASGREAMDAGAGRLGTLAATGAGYVAGGALGGGVTSALENIGTRSGGAFLNVLQKSAAGAGSGVAYTAMVNAIHNWATDDEIPLLQGAQDNSVFGAALGGTIAAATESALALRQKTGRRQSTQGWDGALLPEDAPLAGDATHPLAVAQARTDTIAQAETEGAALREQQAPLYVEPNAPATAEELAQRPRTGTRDLSKPADPTVGAPIYHPVTGEYVGNEPVEPSVGKPIPDNRRTVPGKPRDIMQAPNTEDVSSVEKPVWNPIRGAWEVPSEQAALDKFRRAQPRSAGRDVMDAPAAEHEPGYLPVWNALRGEWETPGEPKPDVNRNPSASVDQGEPNTTGIRESPVDEYTPKGVPGQSGKPRDVMKLPKEYVEPGIEKVRDESLVYAPQSRPDYARLSNPVTDPATGRTIVSDVGTPTNPSTGLRVTLDDTYGARGTMLRTDVIKAVETAGKKIGQFVLRMGLVPEHSAGLYDPQNKEARIALYGDIRAAAHETGHHIGDAAFGSEFSPDRAPQWKAIEQELTRLGKQLYPDTTPHNGHVSEGFAEFAFLWTMQHEDLMRLAPETTKWFDTTFLDAQPEFKSALIASREAADQYRFQGAAKRTQPVDPTSWTMRFRRTNIGEAFQNLRERWLDAAEPLYAMTRAAAEAGAVFEKGASALETFVAKRATADSINSRMVHDGTLNMGRQATGDSLKSVLAPVRGQRKDFSRYLAIRAQQWRNESKTVRDYDSGERRLAGEPIQAMSVDLAHQLNELEVTRPHFRGTADAVLAWYDRVLSYAAEHDPVIAQSVAAMRQEGEFYMPLHRWADWYEAKVQKPNTSNKRAATTGKLSEKSTGSKREIIDPIASIISESRRVIERAHERQVQNAVIGNAVDAGLTGYVSDVTGKMRTKLSEGTPFKPGESYAMPLSDWGAMQVFATEAIQHPDGPIVPFKIAKSMPDGSPGFEIRYYQFDPKLHQAVMSMDPQMAMQALGFLGSTLRFFKGTFVLGAVGLNASFGMLKNPIRDAQTLYVNSRNNPHLVSLIAELAYEHMRVALHQISAGKINYEPVNTYDNLGLDKSDKYATFKTSSRTAKELTDGKIARVIDVVRPSGIIHILSHVMQASEKATRIWEMKGTAKRVGWEPGDYMTPQQAVAMAVDARQVTVDFSAGGSAAQQINNFVPFFNVAIQGPRTYLRAAKESPGTFALRNAALMGLGAALWYRYKDEDWMQSLPADERMRYWYMPFTAPNGEKILARVPLSQDVAVPVKAMEFFLDALHSKDPYKASEYVWAFTQSIAPGGINPLVDEAARQAFNRRQIGEPGEIVNEGNQHKPVEQQIGPNTGPVSTWLGETLHLSPVRVDSALRNTLGGVGSSLADSTIFGLLKNRANKAESVTDIPLLGSLARKGGPVTLQSRNISNLYDLAEVSNRNAASKTDARSVRTRMLLDNATKVVSLSYAILSAGKFTTVERQKLMSIADKIAKDAVEQVQKGADIDATGAIRARVQLQTQARAAKLAVGGEQ